MRSETPQLDRRHWWLAALLLAALFLLALVALLNRQPKIKDEAVYLRPPVMARITGAVARPGEYRVERLGDLLEQGGPLPEANLKGLRRNRLMQEGEELVVPQRAMIGVEVRGAVEREGLYRLDEGATVGDLLKRVALQENAQIGTLRKRQKLEEGAVVEVPFRKRGARS